MVKRCGKQIMCHMCNMLICMTIVAAAFERCKYYRHYSAIVACSERRSASLWSGGVLSCYPIDAGSGARSVLCRYPRIEVEAILPGEPGAAVYAQAAPPPSEDDEIARLAFSSEQAATANGDDNRPGIYLQLGAFANPDNAENLRNHLSRELDWLTEPMIIRPGSGVHRLQLGPYASRLDAEQVAEKIRATLGERPAIVTR